MSAPIIEVEKLSKLYSLGQVGTGSFRQDLKRWWLNTISHKSDPFFLDAHEAASSHLWALRDVSFSVKEGEVFGIIGRNGAGKSTLLKILSNIIRPTHGRVRGRGRINSLLEIGTGFHDELSGRENIYLNGYFLGMNRYEIRKKFDEIVEFSGVSKFLDTPVKRYSSGMYMRLAFAVAAHLNPEILIMDEVLAVGDAAFQRKCLDKTSDIARTGRTILFVSHNMAAIQSLCRRVLWLDGGRIVADGRPAEVISRYLRSSLQTRNEQVWPNPETAPGTEQ